MANLKWQIANRESPITLHDSRVMNPNLNSQIPSVRSLSSAGWATVAGIIGSALLLAKKVFAPKGAKAEQMSRADFYTELLDLKDHMHTNHLAVLEKLVANHRELLAALA
jgi:hypothetical protein